MPRLKETYLQIVEQNRREIRQRTAIGLAQLAETSPHETRTDEDTFVQDQRLPLIVFLFIFLFVLLVVVHNRLH